ANLRNSFTAKDAVSVQSSRKVKNTLNPHFHEDFIFEVDKFEAIKNLVLRLSLYDHERQGRFDAIGHIVLPLCCMSKAGESNKHNLPFKSQTSCVLNANGPQLLVSLSYSSSTDRLTVGILRSKRLLIKKCSLFESLLKGTNNLLVLVENNTEPVYNQTFNFVAPHGFIDEISVVITVCLKGKLKFDSVIGRVISGPIAFASNDKLTHWGKMMFGSERHCEYLNSTKTLMPDIMRKSSMWPDMSIKTTIQVLSPVVSLVLYNRREYSKTNGRMEKGFSCGKTLNQRTDGNCYYERHISSLVIIHKNQLKT
ncbi:unnamed protein product, partial [Medioppia subpectinata]